MQLNKPVTVIFTLLMAVITLYAGHSLLTGLLVTDSTGNIAVISNIVVWVFMIFLGAGTVFLTLFSQNAKTLLAGFGVPIIFMIFMLSFQIGKFLIIMLIAIINAFPETLMAVILMMLMYILAFAIILGLPIGAYLYLITR